MTVPTRVLVIDDSALMRELLTGLITQDPGFEVVGQAADPVVAWDLIKRLRPDVLTLDVEMPRMDGLSFLERLMVHHPLPVVMVSSLTEQGCETTLRALELGAIDVVTKPKLDLVRGLGAAGDELLAKLRVAAQARVGARRASVPPAGPRALVAATHTLVAIGASTGGTEALRSVLTALPADAPAVVIVQHMQERFTARFARRLDEQCAIRVKEAAAGDRVLPGHVLIAPGGRHLRIRRDGAMYVADVLDGAPVNRHRPSVDVLFQSCAAQVGRHALGILLTGMGDDGARGLLAMRQAGARTAAQDEASSVVFGMPREAIRRGAAEQVVPLERVADLICGARVA